MSKYRNRTTFSSFKFATRGLFIAVKTQRNVRTAFLIALIVLFSAVLLEFSSVEIALTLVAISFVVFAELVNTTIEYIVDTYFGNKYSEIAKISKDIAAGTVLFAIFNAAVIGLLLFLPKIMTYITDFTNHLLFIIYP